MPEPRRELIESVLAPALSGVAITMVLMGIDKMKGHADSKSSWAQHFVDSASTHIDIRLFFLGFFIVGITGMLTGWFAIPFIRRWIAAPIFAFAHHAAMLAVGAFLVISVASFSTLSSGDTLRITQVALILLAVGLETFLGEVYCKSSLAAELESKRWWKVSASLMGIFIVASLWSIVVG